MKRTSYLDHCFIFTVVAYSSTAFATTGLGGLDKAFMELMSFVFVVIGIVAATISWRGNRSERTNDSHHTLSIILIVIAVVTWLSASKLDIFAKTSIAVAYPLSLLVGKSMLRWKERRVKPGLVVTVIFALLVVLNPKVIDFAN